MVKRDELRIESPKGISSAIIPVSIENQESTKGKLSVFNAPDSQSIAGKEKEDGSILSVNPLEGEKAIQPDSCIQDKPFIGGDEGSDVNPVEADDLAEDHPQGE
ncbi:hypothetical protein V6N12_066763 [Hibiscus sabdariffa]|uniref:Uncharacterized protein n=1 Tax=Hibiscus sabdariffa TaxID=183260 RepID=A0ABR2C9T2_9ROSI